jgi:hypothetical protein
MDRDNLNEKNNNLFRIAKKKRKVSSEQITRYRHSNYCKFCLCYCQERIKNNPRLIYNVVGHIKINNNIENVLYYN